MRQVLVIAAAAAAVCLGGCAERARVQARTVPTGGSEASFSWAARASHTGDKEVYELVKAPPAVDPADHRERRCEEPGPRFPPTQLYGFGEHREINGTSQPALLADVDDMPWVDGPATRPPTALVTVGLRETPGVVEPIGMYPMATMRSEPRHLRTARTPPALVGSEVGKDDCCNR